MQQTGYCAVVEGSRIQGPFATGNVVEFSSYRQFEGSFTSTVFSIKYVLEGIETYFINGQKIEVKAGHYLLTNASEGGVLINSKKPVKGICLDVEFDLLHDACRPLSEMDSGSGFANLNDWWHFDGPGYQLCHANSSELGHTISSLGSIINLAPSEPHRFDAPFFANIAGCVAAELLPAYTRSQSLSSVTPATRKELLWRLQVGKTFMDDCFTSSIRLDDVSRAAALSLYHFIRLFKVAYGVTPHQYLIARRLNYAQVLLLQGSTPVTDVALSSGFADLPTFSKSFKKAFGVPPQKFRESWFSRKR